MCNTVSTSVRQELKEARADQRRRCGGPQRPLPDAESHRDRVSSQRTLDDHRRLSSASCRLPKRSQQRVRACLQRRVGVRVCVRVFLSTFLPFLYLSFVVFWLRLYN